MSNGHHRARRRLAEASPRAMWFGDAGRGQSGVASEFTITPIPKDQHNRQGVHIELSPSVQVRLRSRQRLVWWAIALAAGGVGLLPVLPFALSSLSLPGPLPVAISIGAAAVLLIAAAVVQLLHVRVLAVHSGLWRRLREAVLDIVRRQSSDAAVSAATQNEVLHVIRKMLLGDDYFCWAGGGSDLQFSIVKGRAQILWSVHRGPEITERASQSVGRKDGTEAATPTDSDVRVDRIRTRARYLLSSSAFPPGVPARSQLQIILDTRIPQYVELADRVELLRERRSRTWLWDGRSTASHARRELDEIVDLMERELAGVERALREDVHRDLAVQREFLTGLTEDDSPRSNGAASH